MLHCSFSAADKNLFIWKSFNWISSSWLRHQKPQWRPPAKGSSLSTCCGIGCYKHLSQLKWVCRAVMFPSRCYLPASGLVPCAKGVHKPKHRRTQPIMCTYPCKNQTVQQSISNPTSENNHVVWAHETWLNSLWNITLKNSDPLGTSTNKSMSAHMQESAWRGGGFCVLIPDKVNSSPGGLTAQTTLLPCEAKGKNSEPSANIDHFIST